MKMKTIQRLREGILCFHYFIPSILCSCLVACIAITFEKHCPRMNEQSYFIQLLHIIGLKKSFGDTTNPNIISKHDILL